MSVFDKIAKFIRSIAYRTPTPQEIIKQEPPKPVIKDPCPICGQQMTILENRLFYSLKCHTGCRAFYYRCDSGGTILASTIISIAPARYVEFQVVRWGRKYTQEEYDGTLKIARDNWIASQSNTEVI
jgi:hypothetical protein